MTPARPAVSTPSVFTDPSGRRWRRVRRGGLVAGVLTTVLAAVVVLGILAPPLLPRLTPALAPALAGRSALARPRLITARAERARLTARHRLMAALAPGPARARGAAATLAAHRRPRRPIHSTARSRSRPAAATVPAAGATATGATATGATATGATATGATATGATLPAAPALVAGFHVSWDDNSLASVRAHAASLDWVVSEAAFVDPATGRVQVHVDPRLLRVLDSVPAARRPRLLLMLSNYASATGRFEPAPARRLLDDPAARAAALDTLRAGVARSGAAGVVLDLEALPDAAGPALARFAAALRDTLRAAPRPAGAPPPIVGATVAADAPAPALAALARSADYVIAMLYDEHYGGGDPGPVASQPWFDARARRMAAVVPPRQLVLAAGAYGYDWNDASGRVTGETMSFQEIVRAARRHGAALRFDPTSRTPYAAWTDADSTDHVTWFLDGVTVATSARTAASLGAAGLAVWRLGDEDPSVWTALDTLRALPPGAVPRAAGQAAAAALATVPPGYDVEFDGDGELLTVAARPTPGTRAVAADPQTGALAGERWRALPTPWVVRRRGADAPHRVALTFDDGPDGAWTPMILDTLAARRAPATFFVVGQAAEGHLPVLRRIVADGHEIGNHTFTHPDLSRGSPFLTRLELDATERLIEAAINRRTALFRPPYFGDAEPTTPDELEPAWEASRLGYVTVGLHIDTEDWQHVTPRQIVATALAERARGNVILLHDGGGDRSATVAALGTLIDSLRARGDTLVPVSALVGVTPAEAMPPLPAGSAALRAAELAAFGGVGVAEWVLRWILLAAVGLGMGRLVLVLGLAVAQRRHAARARATAAPAYWPAVSVLVPAYNEGRVVAATVHSLLAQAYAGPLEIVVVDDGSTDDTYAAASVAFAGDPRVRVYRKPNGGKASALNFALAHATGDVVVGLDADTVFAPDAVAELVAPMADPRVGAVAGNAKVGNRVNLLTRWQAVEYVTSQNLDRRAFALLDGITVVPGAVGAWRADAVRALGGFTHDTLAEDQDLTLRLRRAGWRVAYAERAVAWTEAPERWGAFVKQRFRWSFGTLQCAWKHRDALFRARYGTLGWLALPNVWLFQLLFTALSPLADLLFVWSLVSVWLAQRMHGTSYALVGLRQVVVLYAVFLLVDWLAAALALLLEPGEDRRLAWLVVLQRFAYRQVMYAVVVRAFAAALRGRAQGWGKLERTARVLAPPGARAATEPAA